MTPDAKASTPEAALRQSERFLEPRVKAAERGEVASKSVRQIFESESRARTGQPLYELTADAESDLREIAKLTCRYGAITE